MKVMTAKIVIQSKMLNYDEENDIIKQLHYIIRGDMCEVAFNSN